MELVSEGPCVNVGIFVFIFYLFISKLVSLMFSKTNIFSILLDVLGCDITLNVTDTTQYVATEGYPDEYRNNQNCEFNFVAPPGRTFVVMFEDFNLFLYIQEISYIFVSWITWTHMEFYTHPPTHTHTQAHTCTYTPTHIHTHTPAHYHTHTHRQTHTDTHTVTNTHIHKHTHTILHPL